MTPNDVISGQADVYSNFWPGPRMGCWPTTPGPRTSSTLPSASVMIQWRLKSCTVWSLSLAISMVYAKNHSLSPGFERSGTKRARTETRTLCVTAWDVDSAPSLMAGNCSRIRASTPSEAVGGVLGIEVGVGQPHVDL